VGLIFAGDPVLEYHLNVMLHNLHTVSESWCAALGPTFEPVHPDLGWEATHAYHDVGSADIEDVQELVSSDDDSKGEVESAGDEDELFGELVEDLAQSGACEDDDDGEVTEEGDDGCESEGDEAPASPRTTRFGTPSKLLYICILTLFTDGTISLNDDHVGRKCGPYICTARDAVLLGQPTAWVEGRVITILAEWTVRQLGGTAFAEHLAPLLWLEVQEYRAAVESQNDKGAECRVESLIRLLSHVGPSGIILISRCANTIWNIGVKTFVEI
jgi:hypothetical protein